MLPTDSVEVKWILFWLGEIVEVDGRVLAFFKVIMPTKIELIVKPNPNPEEFTETLVSKEWPESKSSRRDYSSDFMPFFCQNKQ